MGRRIALGATPRAIAALILRDGIRVLGGGCLVGAAVSWLLSCIVQRLIVGQAVVASAALIAVAGLMLIVGIVASLWPAQRAAAADPMKAFRHD
jgi:putative ABC transport system permease protein